MMQFKIIAALAILGAVAFFVWDYTATKEKNKRLTGELNTANTAISALNDNSAEREAIRTIETDLINEIETTPEELDAPTAPVLLDAIGRLR